MNNHIHDDEFVDEARDKRYLPEEPKNQKQENDIHFQYLEETPVQILTMNMNPQEKRKIKIHLP